MRELSSKLIAGGLSAGAILLWWPVLFETDGILSWTIRGVVWTLTFEMLLLALLPLERAFWNDTRPGRTVATRAAGAKSRVLSQQSQKRQVASMAMIAAFVLAIPVSLIVNGPPSTNTAAKEPQKVIQVTKVVRVIERGRVKTVYLPATERQYASADLGTRHGAPTPRPRTTEREAIRTPVKKRELAAEPPVVEQTAPVAPSTDPAAQDTQQ